MASTVKREHEDIPVAFAALRVNLRNRPSQNAPRTTKTTPEKDGSKRLCHVFRRIIAQTRLVGNAPHGIYSQQ